MRKLIGYDQLSWICSEKYYRTFLSVIFTKKPCVYCKHVGKINHQLICTIADNKNIDILKKICTIWEPGSMVKTLEKRKNKYGKRKR